MTNVRRPVHLQLRPTSIALAAKTTTTTTTTTPNTCSPKALSPTGDSLPSQIMPNLFVGNLDQTNRETVNRLNISYILSLGLLPLISSTSPTSPSPTSPATMIIMPNQNTSKDFKIRLRTSSAAANNNVDSKDSPGSGPNSSNIGNNRKQNDSVNIRDENKGVKLVRSVNCKCINIADNSEQILSKFFDEAHQFIDEARRKKCNILVHCLAGISRSPTIAIAYLMRCQSLRLQEAYNLVKQCRPQIDPNLSFMGQLMIYERSLEEQRLAVKKGGHHHNHQLDYSKE